MNYTYYLSANTSSGFVSYFDDYVKNKRKVIVLKNCPKNAKTNLFSQIENYLNIQNTDYDKIFCAGTINDVDAIIVNELSTVIADEGLFLQEVPLYADVIDFSEHMQYDKNIKFELEYINEKKEGLFKRLFGHLQEAKSIHDNLEKIYIDNLNFNKLNIESENIINGIFNGLPSKNVCYGVENLRRFFGTLLPKGNVNYIESLTQNVAKRIYIKGRPGTGKSTFLKKIVSKANELGYGAEVYYCSLDPKSLDMVIIRDIGVAVFDSTMPHEMFPTRPTDEIFDIYNIAFDNDVDLLYQNDIMRITSEYNCEIKKAKECLYSSEAYSNVADKLMYNKDFADECINRIIGFCNFK